MVDNILHHVQGVFAHAFDLDPEFVMTEDRDGDIYVWERGSLWVHEDISDDDGLFRFRRHMPGTPVTMTFPYPR